MQAGSNTSLGQQLGNPMIPTKQICQSQILSSVSPVILKECYYFNQNNVPRINCYNHDGYILTNFCKGGDCLFPLCPECVKMHVDEHFEAKSQPKLDSLDNVLNIVNQTVFDQANQLAQHFENIKNSTIQAQSINDQAVKKLMEIKDRILKIVEQHFNALLNELQNKQQKNFENYSRDAKSFLQVISDRWNSHSNFLEALKRPDCMRYVIPFYKSRILDDNQQYFQQAKEFAQRYQDYSCQIVFDQVKSAQLGSYLGTFFKVTNYDLPEFLDIHKLAPADITALRTGGSIAGSKASIKQSASKQSIQQQAQNSKQNLEISQQSQFMNQSAGIQKSTQFYQQRQPNSFSGNSLGNIGSRKFQ